jgi:hypothetical protein
MLRRLSLLLAAAAVTGTTAASADPDPSQVCYYKLCVCVTTTKCASIPVDGSSKCFRVDVDDDGSYETICV